MRFAYMSMDATGLSGNDAFKDVRVRQAVNYAINRNAIVAKLVGAGARVLNAACYPSQFGCDESVKAYEYNPEKAKQLLAEAGYANGFDVDIYGYRDRPVTEAMIGDLRNVGIRAKLTSVRFATFKELASQTKIPLRHATFGSWSISDISIVMEGFFQGVDEDNSQDKDVIAWTKEAGRIIDADKRKELYSKALKRIAEQAYWAPLHTYGVLYAFHSDLDFKSNPDEVARFYNAKWK
jgi:peptide/nickel transport system substrate-binding protein